MQIPFICLPAGVLIIPGGKSRAATDHILLFKLRKPNETQNLLLQMASPNLPVPLMAHPTRMAPTVSQPKSGAFCQTPGRMGHLMIDDEFVVEENGKEMNLRWSHAEVQHSEECRCSTGNLRLLSVCLSVCLAGRSAKDASKRLESLVTNVDLSSAKRHKMKASGCSCRFVGLKFHPCVLHANRIVFLMFT